jgi:deoxyribonuclease (pyrimidine dimer)
MTRINCVPVDQLCREHLVAEYRELPRLAKRAAQKHTKNPNFVSPDSYRLGRGHMDFFVDKGKYLARRFSELVEEMKARGYNPAHLTYPIDLHPEHWRQDWRPDDAAKATNMARINERLASMRSK